MPITISMCNSRARTRPTELYEALTAGATTSVVLNTHCHSALIANSVEWKCPSTAPMVVSNWSGTCLGCVKKVQVWTGRQFIKVLLSIYMCGRAGSSIYPHPPPPPPPPPLLMVGPPPPPPSFFHTPSPPPP